MSPQMQIFDTVAELSNEVGQLISELSANAIKARRRFTVALSGGSMPKLLADALTAEPLRSQIDWSKWHVFWADERLVALDHSDSNYYAAQRNLFQAVNIPPTQIYPLNDSLAVVAAAGAYQETLAQLFQPAGTAWPRFDLILLGMGEDGHTASLFPGHPLLQNCTDWVAPIFDSPKPPPQRITLTLPLINKARQVAFIATGASKASALSQIFTPTPAAEPLPAALIQPPQGEVHWFVDEAAADLL